ncbi:MAG TPA: NUDIX hydrolase [bacterium]|jgi:ADP-ribose pyrophosphatase YjhB (NUDIX family)
MIESIYKFCPICAGPLKREIVENIWRLRCQTCGEIHYENPKPSVALLVRNERGELLLVKRNVDPGAGRWCLPGGFIEMGESAQDAARRELHEETGLEGELIRVVDAASKLNGYYGDVVVIAFEARVTGGELKPGDDASDVRYFATDQLPDIAFGSHEKFIRTLLDS